MDFGKAFSYVFDDEDWIKKIGIGGLLAFTIIGLIPVLGWGFEITKRVIRGDEETLPDWSDFGGYITRGFLVFVIVFVFMLPIFLVQGCGSIPYFFDPGDQETFTTVMWFVTSCFGCLNFIYGIAAYLVLPAAIGNYAATDELGAAFKLGEIFKMVRDNIGTYALVLLGGIVAYLISGLGVIACGIGVFLTMVYAIAINGHLWGQAYVDSKSLPTADPSEPIPATD
ncbi:MAG: DUF4013 domain-containing protein [Anaerolineales bacterium]|nr:DUF4013 domain-containing protein [Anaerolineales bacterium]